jgi:hypothetical protein
VERQEQDERLAVMIKEIETRIKDQIRRAG